MIISRRKKAENIVEYVIYMWQLEELCRSLSLDNDRVNAVLVEPQDIHPQLKEEMRQWYADLMKQMKNEGLEKQGHLSDVIEVMNELEMLHHTMTGILNHQPYIQEWEKVKEDLAEAKKKMKGIQGGEVEVGLMVMFGVLSLRMKKAEISKETEAASKKIADWLGLLAGHFQKMKSGDWNVGGN